MPSTSSIADADLAAVEVVDLGRLGYREAHAAQLDRVARRQRGECSDAIMLVEHPHVITVGRSRAALANVLAPGEVDVIEVERGGDVTYHGPGQVVAYPIVLLGDGERDLHAFLRNIEEAVIRTAAEHNVAAGREAGKTGVWTRTQPARKLASIGIACRKWVTFHGVALNVDPDLGYFHRINPCGFEASVMTSLAAETGGAIDFATVKRKLATHLATTLHRSLDG